MLFDDARLCVFFGLAFYDGAEAYVAVSNKVLLSDTPDGRYFDLPELKSEIVSYLEEAQREYKRGGNGLVDNCATVVDRLWEARWRAKLLMGDAGYGIEIKIGYAIDGMLGLHGSKFILEYIDRALWLCKNSKWGGDE